MSIAHTRVFYTVLMEDDHSALLGQEDPLTALLCPDCRLQNKYGDQARSENGQVACVQRLRRLQAVLLPLPGATRQGMLVPVSTNQTLIYFSLQLNAHDYNDIECATGDRSGDDEEADRQRQRQRQEKYKVTLGVGLQWERGVVVGIVVRHVLCGLDPDYFLNLVMYSAREEAVLHVCGVVLSVEEAKEGQLEARVGLEDSDSGSCSGSGSGSTGSTSEMISVSCSPVVSSSSSIASATTATKGDAEDSRSSPPPRPRPRPRPRGVHFSDTLTVVLVPIVLSNAREGRSWASPSSCFYRPQDYQRFSRQRDFEVTDAMREEGLGQEEALEFLYLLEGSAEELQTEHNYHLTFEGEEEEEVKEEDQEENEVVQTQDLMLLKQDVKQDVKQCVKQDNEKGDEQDEEKGDEETMDEEKGEEKVAEGSAREEGVQSVRLQTSDHEAGEVLLEKVVSPQKKKEFEYRERLSGWSDSRHERQHPLALDNDSSGEMAAATAVDGTTGHGVGARRLQEALFNDIHTQGGRDKRCKSVPRQGADVVSMIGTVSTLFDRGDRDRRQLADDYLLDVQRQGQGHRHRQRLVLGQGEPIFMEFATASRDHPDPLNQLQLHQEQKQELVQSRGGGEVTGRSLSADGRMQTTVDKVIGDAFVDERIGWFPGKFLQQLRGDNDSDRESNDDYFERQLGVVDTSVVVGDGKGGDDDGNMENVKQKMKAHQSPHVHDTESDGGHSSSVSSSRTASSDVEVQRKQSSWYFGKYIKRLMTKTEDEDEEKEAWYFGKYVNKAMSRLPAKPPRSQQIFNHTDSLRLNSASLRTLRDAMSSPDEQSSDSEDSDDSEELGMHRGRGSRGPVRLPRLPSVGWLLGRSVARGVLPLPSPPVEVMVTVLGCRGLRSPSLLPPYSPVSFVEVSVGDNALQRTHQAPRSSKPVFDSTAEAAMHFSLPCADTPDEYVLFTVFERFVVTGQKAPLCQARLSLAALPVHVDSSEAATLTLKLLPCTVPATPATSTDVTVGKGLYCPVTAAAASGWHSHRVPSKGDGPRHQRSYDEVKRAAHKVTTSIGGGSPPGKKPRADSSDLPATITILISKTDTTMFAVLKQLQEEDEANEHNYQQRSGKKASSSSSSSSSVLTPWFDEEMCFQDNFI